MFICGQQTIMIKLINLTKKYGKLTAVNGINLEVRSGEVFGFLGPNGAGKTTTIKMMAGLLQPTGGSVQIGDFDVQKEPLKAKFITGFIPDRPFLYEKLTATEFMQFVASLYEMNTRKRSELPSSSDSPTGGTNWSRTSRTA
jgi:ABC-2 type transport system ATP-binding protein